MSRRGGRRNNNFGVAMFIHMCMFMLCVRVCPCSQTLSPQPGSSPSGVTPRLGFHSPHPKSHSARRAPAAGASLVGWALPFRLPLLPWSVQPRKSQWTVGTPPRKTTGEWNPATKKIGGPYRRDANAEVLTGWTEMPSGAPASNKRVPPKGGGGRVQDMLV